MGRIEQRWQRLSKRQQLIAVIGASVLLLVVMNAVAFRPLHQRLSRLRREVRDTERRLVEAVVASSQAEAVNRAFEAYVPYAEPPGASESELASLLSEVESAIRESGVVLLSLKPLSPQDGQPPHTLSVTLEGEASPERLVRFLHLVQRSVHLLQVTSLVIRVTDERILRSAVVISKRLL